MHDCSYLQIYDHNLTTNAYLQILRDAVTDWLDNIPLNDLQNCWLALTYFTHGINCE